MHLLMWLTTVHLSMNEWWIPARHTKPPGHPVRCSVGVHGVFAQASWLKKGCYVVANDIIVNINPNSSLSQHLTSKPLWFRCRWITPTGSYETACSTCFGTFLTMLSPRERLVHYTEYQHFKWNASCPTNTRTLVFCWLDLDDCARTRAHVLLCVPSWVALFSRWRDGHKPGRLLDAVSKTSPS